MPVISLPERRYRALSVRFGNTEPLRTGAQPLRSCGSKRGPQGRGPRLGLYPLNPSRAYESKAANYPAPAAPNLSRAPALSDHGRKAGALGPPSAQLKKQPVVTALDRLENFRVGRRHYFVISSQCRWRPVPGFCFRRIHSAGRFHSASGRYCCSTQWLG